MANLANQTPVSGQNTVFRIASVSKVFISIAVLQQVEKGVLDLDTDVNQYLKLFKVAQTFSKPTTLRHLLTHTAGFEEKFYSDLSLSAKSQQPLGEHLATALPLRVFPVSLKRAYSNYGSALAGYIVEQISGQDFADYMVEKVLAPAGMTRSGYRLGLC